MNSLALRITTPRNNKDVLYKKKKDVIVSEIALKTSRHQEIQALLQQKPVSQLMLWLKECVETSDGFQQVNLIKKIGLALQKSRMAHSQHVNLCLSILVEIYFQTENRHLTKRAIASTLQTMPTLYHPKIVENFNKTLEEAILSAINTQDYDTLRSLVNNIMSCLENFNLGAQCVAESAPSVLQFICSALVTFRKQLEISSCPTTAMKASMNCQATVRTLILILQKFQNVEKCQIDFQSDGFSQKTLIRLMDNIIHLLLNENNSVDCRCNCSMALPLLIQHHKGSEFMRMITLLIFSHSNHPNVNTEEKYSSNTLESPLNLLKASSPVSKLCTAIGFLSAMNTCDLLMELDTGITIFFDVLMPHIMAATKQVKESSITVLTSRAVLLWTKRAKEALQEQQLDHELCAKLKGNGDISCQILEYVWTHWEHFIDSVRHITKDIFNNVVELHILSSGEAPEQSPFILWLVESLLKMPSHQRGRYSTLCCLVTFLGAQRILTLQPTLPTDLLAAMREQTLFSHASDLIETLFTTHKSELCKNISEWESIWVIPVITAISERPNIGYLEHILLKLLKCSPSSLNFIISELMAVEIFNTVGRLRALLITAKTARSLGMIMLVNDDNYVSGITWNQLFPIDIIKLALCHVDDEIRLDAFALLCDTPKTSEILTPYDIELIRAFLLYNMSNQSPAFRQKLLALMKKLIIRIYEGGQSMLRQLRQLIKREPDSEDINILKIKIDSYQKFLRWLCVQQFDSLYPGANFPRRGMALNVLRLLHQIVGFQNKESELSLVDSLTPANVQTLLECLRDTYETNKIIALDILKSLSEDQLGFNDYTRVAELFEVALNLASRLRPVDCVTAAYLFRLLSNYTRTWSIAVSMKQVLEDSSLKASQTTSGDISPQNMEAKESSPSETGGRTRSSNSQTDAPEISHTEIVYATLDVLTFQLMVELDMARRNLLEAAANGPMYGVLFCIRSLLLDLDFKQISKEVCWKSYMSTFIGLCLELGEVVGPIVRDASPEGYLPPSADGEELEQLRTHLQKVLRPSSKSVAEKSDEAGWDAEEIALLDQGTVERTRSVTAQMLLLCGWRTMKEISLVLGDICHRSVEIIQPFKSSPVVNLPNVNLIENKVFVIEDGRSSDDLVSIELILQIGEYFITLLAETKHRGAFEQAYVGFCKVCDGLWRSPIVELHRLPQQWLQELLEHIRNNLGTSSLCSTRRSAGLPFMVQALVSSEPDVKGSSCFKRTMEDLLEMAMASDCTEEVKVHSFNILRALYRDTKLGDEVTPYVADGLISAIIGFRAETWGVRNSATLLFSTLVTRIFGVKRSKDELSKKNCMTGTVFFQRYPKLYQFLLDELDNCTRHSKENLYGIQIRPSIYPILLILARLYPSSIEGMQSSVKLSSFVPLVQKCGCRPIMKTRILAAKAMVPLVPFNDRVNMVEKLLLSLPNSVVESLTIGHNAIHGTLLQIYYLIKEIVNTPFSSVEQDLLKETFSHFLQSKLWIASRTNTCHVTRAAFLDIINSALSSDLLIPEFSLNISEIANQGLSTFKSFAGPIPGAELLQISLAKVALQLSLVCYSAQPNECSGNSMESEGSPLPLQKCIVKLLCHEAYEVRWTTLHFLYDALALTNPHNDKLQLSSLADLSPLPDPTLPFKDWKFLNQSNAKLIAGVLHSDELITILLTMLSTTEHHLDCIAQLCHLLPLLPKALQMPWPCPSSEKDLEFASEKMELILQKGGCEPRDDIRSAFLHLSGFLIPLVYDELEQAKQLKQCDVVEKPVRTSPHLVLNEWTEAFLLCCSWNQSLRVRLTSVMLLIRNSRILLLDPKDCLGSSSMSVWSAAVMLLRDDEPFIKKLTSNVVEMCSREASSQEGIIFDTAIQPSLALDVLIGQFVIHFGNVHQSECLTMLLDWMLQQDVQDTTFLFDEEDRMFDRGQMNIYNEEINFTNLIQKHFKTLLLKIFHLGEHGVTQQNPSIPKKEIRRQAIVNLGRQQSQGTFSCLPQSLTLDMATFQDMSDDFKGIMSSFKVTSKQDSAWFSDPSMEDLPCNTGSLYLQDIIDMVVEELTLVLKAMEEVTHQTPFLSFSYDQNVIQLYRLITVVYCLCKYDNAKIDPLIQIRAMLDDKFHKVHFCNRAVDIFIASMRKLCSFHEAA